MTRARRLLLDVGGTFIKCADGRSVPIRSDGSRAEITASLQEAVWGPDGLGGPAPEAVAVAIPGPFDYSEGVFQMRHKFAAVYGSSFRELAALPEGIPLRFIHDVNCMLLGALQQIPSGSRRVALVTLGTGLGFAYSIDGAVQFAPSGGPALSIWNRPYLDGTAEDYASKRGFARVWTEVTGLPWPEGRSVKDLSDAARAGDGDALRTFEAVALHLAAAARTVLEETGVDRLLLGGQIAKSFELLEGGLRRGLDGLASLRHIGPIPHLDSATFDGLLTLLA